MPRRLSRPLARTLLAVSALSLHASIASAQECRKDMDCAGDTVCDEGRCVGVDGPASKPMTTAPTQDATPAGQPAAPPAPAPGSVKVDFVARDPKETFVVRDRHTSASCTVPCSLNLPPGVRSIQIGESSRPEELDVSAQGGTYSVAKPARGQRTAGIVLLSVGAPVALLSALLAVAASSSADDTQEVTGEDDSDARSAATTLTVIAAVAGAAAVAGLVALVTADTKAFRPAEARAQARAKTPRRLVPTAGLDPRGGGFFGLAASF